jgi:DNA invertase Pin-like site-specific DNA recombinase
MEEILFDPYYRKSNKDMSRSVQRQRADLKDGAEEQGIALSDREFVDPDLSASRFAKKARPDYQALLEHIDSGRCRGIGLAEASRGSRSLTEWSTWLDQCRAKDVKIWVQAHGRVYDLKRRQDWRTLADEGVNSQDESERLSERVSSGKRKAAREGKPAGPLVYGYTRLRDEAGKVVSVQQHKAQAPIVKELFRRVAKGEALYTIAADLTKRGIKTPRRATEWTTATVRTMVMSPTYIGKRVHQGVVIGDGMWPAIVDEKLHRRVVGILTRPERRTTTRGTELAHWLSAVALCGVCKIDRLRAGSPARYYCAKCFGVRVAMGPFEDLVERAVLGRLADASISAVWAPRQDTGALDQATEHLADLRATMKAYYQKAALRQLSPEGLVEMEALLKPQIDTAETRVKVLSTPTEIAALGTPTEIIEMWPTLGPADKRKVVRVIANLVVSPAVRKGGRGADPRRLDESRWVGDPLTWGEHYRQHETAAALAA